MLRGIELDDRQVGRFKAATTSREMVAVISASPR
jgi:hypothetical protein